MSGASGKTIAIGLVVGIFSSAAQSVGLTMQRKSHMLEDEKPLGQIQRPPYKRKRWLFGMGLFLVTNIFGSGFQITALPLVIYAPLQASSLVFNSICATLFLSEPFTRYSLIGTILVTAGAILIAAFGALPEPNHTLEELLYLLRQRPFLLWFFITIFIAVVLLVVLRMMRTWKRGHTHRGKLIRGLLFGVVSGIGSAHSLLLAKSAVELLVQSVINKNNQFNRYETWLILLGLVVLALTQLYFLHEGLKLCSTSVLYPLVFCIYNIIAILDGLIYFQQASRLSPLQIGLVALGTIILLVGVACLSWRLTPEPAVAALLKDDAETLATMTGRNTDDDASESDALLISASDEESGLPSTGLRPALTSSSYASTKSSKGATRPWTSKKLGSVERNEIWDELGDYDADELDVSGREYLISVAYNDAEDEEESISDESLTATTSSSSGGAAAANGAAGLLGRVQNMIRSRRS
ncbi:magnesium transporter NIPA-domain-containing protein [Myxozyma melibiosi]|uniref:Magnesium transporter NIPA-domain-containing protein n=1 Tax=Myxozyma melibiosi TaxID=54550 RepID=A0ABR1F4T5_9ASCO